MLVLLRRIAKVLTVFSVPLAILLDIGVFTLKHIFFGHNSSGKYLERVSTPSVIPILRLYGASIGKHCDIQSGITFHNCYDYSNLTVGDNCHIGKNCFFDLREKIVIGNNVVISMQCTLITHMDMTKSDLSTYYPAEKSPIHLHDNSYLGMGAVVLMGVSVGSNAFLAARSVAAEDVMPHTMVGGCPAKLIKTLPRAEKV